jgi:hypothetical protein
MNFLITAGMEIYSEIYNFLAKVTTQDINQAWHVLHSTTFERVLIIIIPNVIVIRTG